MNVIKIKMILSSLWLFTNLTYAQSTKDLLNIVIQDIAYNDCNIELQRNMKVLCLGFDTTKINYQSLKSIRINPYVGYWDSTQIDYVSEVNNFNIIIEKKDTNCYKNNLMWHCLLSPISYNQDSSIALIQYYKDIPSNTKNTNEFGTILYKYKDGQWIRDYIIDQSSHRTLITR